MNGFTFDIAQRLATLLIEARPYYSRRACEPDSFKVTQQRLNSRGPWAGITNDHVAPAGNVRPTTAS